MNKRLGFTLLLLINSLANAETINVAVPANFLKPMQLIADKYEQESGHKIILHSGSTGQLFAQATHGAPFDLFLSADEERVDALEAQQQVSDSHLYSCGILAFYSRRHTVSQLEDIAQLPSIGIANPKLAPFGKAAEDALSHLTLQDQTRLVYGQNIAMSYQYAMHEAVSGSFVAYSHVYDHEPEFVWLVPKRYYAPIKQKMAILSHSSHKTEVHKLYRYILSDEIQLLISQLGYTQTKDC
ncbi:MAG: molybdate ABC transporter substrate-binding protein [Kangiella sp.]|nr:molybdate ABC transporter substrate-binding protein [Kangiella sp.]